MSYLLYTTCKLPVPQPQKALIRRKTIASIAGYTELITLLMIDSMFRKEARHTHSFEHPAVVPSQLGVTRTLPGQRLRAPGKGFPAGCEADGYGRGEPLMLTSD